MTLSLAVKVLDIRDILLFFFDAIDNYYREVVSVILFLHITILRMSLLVLAFSTNLVLVGKRLLEVLFTRYINMGRVSRLILSNVFILLFGWLILLGTLGINLSGV